MSVYNKVFFHGVGNGIGLMMASLDTAGIPITAKATETNAGWPASVAEARKASGVPHTIIYRDTTPGGAPNDHPDYSLIPEASAAKHWKTVRDSMPSEIVKHKDVIWIEPVNEIDTVNPGAEWLGRFCFAIGELAMTDGWKVLLSGFNAGQPDVGQWVKHFSQFLALCADNPTKVGVSLHESKTGAPVDTHPEDPRIYPWMLGRWKFLHDACDQLGYARPTMVISEWAWAYNDMPSKEIAMRDIRWLSESIAPHPNIKGVCLWNLDSHPNWGSLPGKLAELIDDVEQFTQTVRYPDVDPEPPSECEEFDFPVGDPDTWPNGWENSNGYAALYVNPSTGNQSYHTGADLNLNVPALDSDRGADVRSIKEGTVIHAGWYPVWGNVVVIEHPFLDGVIYSRYGHIDNVLVRQNQLVSRGDKIGSVGRDALGGPFHLHFDISATSVLRNNPEDWPGMSLDRVLKDYVDPIKFIVDNDGACGVPMPERIKHTIHLLPQNTTVDELVATAKKLHATRTAFTYSHDVAHAVMYAGNKDSIVVLWDPERWDFDVRGYFENMGVNIEVRYFQAVVPPPIIKPDPTLIDMAKFFLPPNQLNKGYIVNISNNWGQGNERTQLQRADNGHSLLTKNQQYEERVIGTEFIDLILDSSPGDGEYYTSSGHWIPRKWKPGAIYESGAKEISFFRQSDCSRVDGKTYTQSPTRLVFAGYHTMWTSPLGLVFLDVAQLEWQIHGIVDETYWFADGLGLVRWLKYDGRESNAFEIIQPGQQDNNIPDIIHCAR